MKKIKYTIEYIIDPKDTLNHEMSLLDTLNEYGRAEVVDVNIIEVEDEQ